MYSTTNNIIMGNGVFKWIALVTVLILLIPLLAMQFTNEVNWGIVDFMVMGLLLFSMASSFVLVARKIPPKRRTIIGFLFLLAFLYLWAELAVGIFTNLGS